MADLSTLPDGLIKMMDRTRKGAILATIGTVLFVFSFFFVLPVEALYIPSLVIMFISVILIGVGGALVKGFDRSIEIPSEECYFCGGTGMVDAPDGGRTHCPRCGGTGISPDVQSES